MIKTGFTQYHIDIDSNSTLLLTGKEKIKTILQLIHPAKTFELFFVQFSKINYLICIYNINMTKGESFGINYIFVDFMYM